MSFARPDSSYPRKPADLSLKAWCAMQEMRNGDLLFLTEDDECCVGLGDHLGIEVAEELIAKAFIREDHRGRGVIYYRLNDLGHSVAAGDK